MTWHEHLKMQKNPMPMDFFLTSFFRLEKDRRVEDHSLISFFTERHVWNLVPLNPKVSPIDLVWFNTLDDFLG